MALQSYSYATKGGGLGSVKARDEASALSHIGGLADADPRSGIISNPPGISSNDGTPKKEPVVLSSKGGRKTVDEKITPTVTEGSAAMTGARTNSEQNASTTEEDDPEMDALRTTEERLQRESDREFKERQKMYKSLAIANTEEATADVASLQSMWDSTRKSQTDANKLEGALVTQAGLRGGQSRYAPELQANYVADVQNRGILKLKEIDDKYSSAISKTRSALRVGNLQLALQASREAQTYRDEAIDEIRTQKKEAAEIAKKATEAKTKVTRQSSIIELFKQGVTDPKALFDMLNYDEAGNETGSAVSLNEIDEVLDRIRPSGDGAFKFSNDDLGKLLSVGLGADDIQNMMDDLNEGGYDTVMQGLTGAQRGVVAKVLGGVKAGGSTSVGGSLTISEAQKLGLPIALVGASQGTVLGQLTSSQPPGWFQEHVTSRWADPDAPVNPQGLRELWDEFRFRVQDDFESGTSSSSSSSSGSDLDADIDSLFPGG